jgi:hypothetical protein
MDFSNVRSFTLAAAAIAATSATTAYACEQCNYHIDQQGGGESVCWSGYDNGVQYCFGGFGEPCSVGGSCHNEVPTDCHWSYCQGEAEDDWMCWAWGWCKS